MANRSSKHKSVSPAEIELTAGINLLDDPSSIDTKEMQEAVNVFYPRGQGEIESRFAVKVITTLPIGEGSGG